MPLALDVAEHPGTIHENKPGTYRWREPSKWKRHQFTCWDGEGFDIDGQHQYVYLCAYNGKDYFETLNENGLGSEECFRFLVEVAARHKYGINVIYGGSYDANMMLRDVSIPRLMELQQTGTCRWRDWRLSFINRKEFVVTHIPTQRKGTCKLWDVIGFFQCSFESAIDKWLGVTDKTIHQGKKSRSAFNKKDLPFIIEYCKRELLLFERLMQKLWSTLNAVGVKLQRWDGSGAVAQSFLMAKRIKPYLGTEEANELHYVEARTAYAGGRFELISPGDYQCRVFNADINSAYPFGMTLLPPFTGLRECHKRKCKYGPYDLLKVEYSGDSDTVFHPYFHRHDDFAVSYPLRTVGWHWGIEHISCGGLGKVVAHLHWDDSGARPLSWVKDLYAYRYELKEAGNKAELAVKLIINSLYGKFVQQRGWVPGKKRPMFHNLYYGGWITAYTRSMIYRAMMQQPESVIAVETDGIFTTKQLELPYGVGLGEWGLKEYDSLTYVQSGMYFGTASDGEEVAKYRGLDRGQLTREMVLNAWEDFQRGGKGKVRANSTRFRTLGTSLVGARLDDWRQWKVEKKDVALVASGKRLHDPFCKEPWGRGTHHSTIAVQPRNQLSKPYNVLWADTASRLQLYQEIEEEWESIIYEN